MSTVYATSEGSNAQGRQGSQPTPGTLTLSHMSAPAAPSSAILTAYRLPAGYSYDELHNHLKARGFVIYGGQGSFAREIFCIAVMGDFNDRDAARLLAAVRELVQRRAEGQ
jgi:aspartate aminotransferase-like enzyme